jgi:hypothetical protein
MLTWKAAGSVWRNLGQPEPGRLLLCSLGRQLSVYGVTLDSQNQIGYCYAHLESSWQCMRNFGQPKQGGYCYAQLESSWQCMA